MLRRALARPEHHLLEMRRQLRRRAGRLAANARHSLLLHRGQLRGQERGPGLPDRPGGLILGGATGHVFGNDPIWLFGARLGERALLAGLAGDAAPGRSVPLARVVPARARLRERSAGGRRGRRRAGGAHGRRREHPRLRADGAYDHREPRNHDEQRGAGLVLRSDQGNRSGRARSRGPDASAQAAAASQNSQRQAAKPTKNDRERSGARSAA